MKIRADPRDVVGKTNDRDNLDYLDYLNYLALRDLFDLVEIRKTSFTD